MDYPDYHIGISHALRDAAISSWISQNIQKDEYHKYGMVGGFTDKFFADCLAAVQMVNTMMNRVLVHKLSIPHNSRLSGNRPLLTLPPPPPPKRSR